MARRASLQRFVRLDHLRPLGTVRIANHQCRQLLLSFIDFGFGTLWHPWAPANGLVRRGESNA
jgi:hypothetical protein